jgi:hypothetical protein
LASILVIISRASFFYQQDAGGGGFFAPGPAERQPVRFFAHRLSSGDVKVKISPPSSCRF